MCNSYIFQQPGNSASPKNFKSISIKSAAFLCVFLLFQISTQAQEIYDLNKHLTQPEFSSFQKPAQPTVDSQGNLNLSIALGTVTGRGIDYPITLSYQSGIRVLQPSSWVGLGWNFSPGSISRTPNTGPYDYHTNTKSGVDTFDPSNNNNAPDMFTVSIPGRGSVQMVQVSEPSYTSTTIPVYQTGDFLTLDHKAWKIEYQTAVVTVGGISTGERPDTFTAYDHHSKVNKSDFSKFLITVEDGTRYLFAEPSLAYVDVHEKVGIADKIIRQDYVSTWRLVAIFGPDYMGNEWLVPSNTASGSWVKLTYNAANTDSDHPNRLQFRQTIYLDEIRTRISSAKFTLSDRMEPMLGEWEKHSGLNINYTQKKIDKVELNIGSTATKTFDFIHDNSFNPMSSSHTNRGRLKLKEIRILGDQGGSLPGYSFEYVSNPSINWPYGMRYDEMTACIDEFGFYNNSRLGYVNDVSSSKCSGLDNANSGADSWSISSITYPTGAKDMFSYETRSVKGNLELDFYMPNEPLPDKYKPWFNATANDDVFVGGPRVKNITRRSNFENLGFAEDYFQTYAYGDGTGISGVPTAYLKRRYTGNSNVIFGSNSNSAAIYYGRVTTTYYGGGGDGTGSFLALDKRYYTFNTNPLTIIENAGAPCPATYYFDDPTPQCWALYIWNDNLSWDWGKEIDMISTDITAGYSRQNTSSRISQIAGSSNPGRSNHVWTIELGHQNYKTVSLYQRASRLTSILNRDGETNIQVLYDYDLRTSLVSHEKTKQSPTSFRIKKITRAHEISSYSTMKNNNLLSQVVREDFGEETSGTTTWKRGTVTTWKDQGIDTDPLFWKPWKTFSWNSTQTLTGNTQSFTAWTSGSTPSNWILNEEMTSYDGHGNLKERLFPNGTKVAYQYSNQASKLQSVTVTEGITTNPETISVSLQYTNPFDKVSKITDQFGVDTYYNYDEFGRLIEIKNDNQQLVSTYRYDYGLLNSNQEHTLNRIIETTYTNPSDTSKNVRSYQYFDGLARLRQTVTEADGGGYSVVHQDFDAMGFTERTWNPYLDATTTNGDFVLPADAHSRNKLYYRGKLFLGYDPHPYTRKEYFGVSSPRLLREFPAWTDTEVNSHIYYDLIGTVNGQSVRAIEQTDESGNKVKNHYNYFGELVRTTVAENVGALNLNTDYEYDEVGNLIKTTSPAGLVTTYTYNTLGQKTKESLPDMENDREFRYDNLGRLRFVQDPNQKSSRQNLSYVVSGGTSVTKTILANSAGKLELYFCVTDLFMDDYTLTIKRVETNSTIYQKTFSPEGDCVGSPTNPLTFNVTAGTYTLTGQAADPGEPIISTLGNYGFESNDIFTYTKYDDLNRPIETGQYSGGVTFSAANANDETFPTSGHDPQIQYYYNGDHPPLLTGYTPNNANGRLTKVSYRDQSTTSGWSHEGYSYNSQGLVEWKILDLNLLSTSKLIEYQYDSFGRLTRTDYQPTTSTDRFITWQEYDDYGRLKYVYTDTDVNVSGRRKAIEYIYDHDGRVIEKKLGNSNVQRVNYSYTVRGWLEQINNLANIATDKFAMKLSYTANGNISQQQWRQSDLNSYLATYNYGYDSANRLTSANFSGSGYSVAAFDVSNINYDRNGNITGFIRNNRHGSAYPDGYLVFAHENNTNRLTNIQDQVDYINWDVDHDASGNMIKNQLNGLSSAQYDWRNLASQMIANSTTLYYAYDANGKRTKKKVNSTETHYVRGMGGEVLAVYENDGIKMHNIYAGSDLVGNYDRTERRYFIKDHLGSIRTTVDQHGNVDGYTDYYPFGKTMPDRSFTNQGTALNANKYTGHERDTEAGLTIDYMLARNYDSHLGRFMQIDPVLQYSSPYTYVGNNPLLLIDPTGMEGDYFDSDGNHLGNDGLDDDKVYITTKEAVNENSTENGTIDAEAISKTGNSKYVGQISDFVDFGGYTISSKTLQNRLVGLAIFSRNKLGDNSIQIQVTGGDRSVGSNSRVGGARASRHLVGDAADIKSDQLSNSDLSYSAFNSGLFSTTIYYPAINVSGALRPHVHVDLRPRSNNVHLEYTPIIRNGKFINHSYSIRKD